MLVPGGSERGLSYYSGILPCPKAHYYRYRETSAVPGWGQGSAQTGKPSPFMVGTMFHAYLETWYTTGSWARLAFVDSLTSDFLAGFPKEQDEAWRLFDAYSKHLPRNEAKDAVTEADVSDTSGDLGVPLITARIDMIARFPGGSLAKSNTDLPAGLYLWEHKTADARSSYLFEKHRVQVQLNMYLWNKANPDQPVLGGILNNVVKNKEPVVERLLIPTPTDKDMDNLRKSLSFAWHLHETVGDQMVALKETCMGKFSPCQFYKRCWS